MLTCPKCGHDTSVKETRSLVGGIRRRRICDDVACNTRITTIELVAVNPKAARGDYVLVERSVLDRTLKCLRERLFEFESIAKAPESVPIDDETPEPEA